MQATRANPPARPGPIRRVARALRRPARVLDRAIWLLKPRRLSPVDRCIVCGGAVSVMDLTSHAAPKRTCRMELCSKCGHVSNPGNTRDYREFKQVSDMYLSPRVGTEDRAGREYFMAQMAVDILGRDDLDVLVYSAGRSLDNHHIERLPGVRSVAISDIMRLRDDAEFYDSSQPATRRFPIVIASEVIEHFLNPREDFERLFGFVEPDGLLVCSTNVYDGGNLRRHSYAFIRGHTSYYTAASLAELARTNGWTSELRVPLAATGYAGPRKKYVLFTQSPTVRKSITEYFRHHRYAPSEPPWDGDVDTH